MFVFNKINEMKKKKISLQLIYNIPEGKKRKVTICKLLLGVSYLKNPKQCLQ